MRRAPPARAPGNLTARVAGRCGGVHDLRGTPHRLLFMRSAFGDARKPLRHILATFALNSRGYSSTREQPLMLRSSRAAWRQYLFPTVAPTGSLGGPS